MPRSGYTQEQEEWARRFNQSSEEEKRRMGQGPLPGNAYSSYTDTHYREGRAISRQEYEEERRERKRRTERNRQQERREKEKKEETPNNANVEVRYYQNAPDEQGNFSGQYRTASAEENEKNNQFRQQQLTNQEILDQNNPNEQSFWENVANAGLEPVSLGTNAILSATEYLSGQEQGAYGRSSIEQIRRDIPGAGGAGLFIALGGTVAMGAEVAGLIKGIGAIGTTATAGTAAGKTTSAAAGIVSRYGTAAQTATAIERLGEVANNTATATKKISYLRKLARSAKNPTFVLGVLASAFGLGFYTTQFWAPNEKGDAITTLTIAQKTALDRKNYNDVLAIAEQIEDAANIATNIPLVGFAEAEMAKFNAGVKTSEIYKKEALNAIEKERERKRKTTEEEMANPQEKKEPKWIQIEGKWKPNLKNKNWKKERNRNVWTGD
jgi:hypothetical protein